MEPAKAGSSLQSKMKLEFQRVLSAPAKGSTISRCSIATHTSTISYSGGLSLKESAKERRRFIRDADDLVCCLTIEFEIVLGLGSTVVPVGKKLELAPPKAPLRERGASDGDAHARRLPGDPAFLCDRFGRGDDPARDETRPAFVLAREDEDRIAFGDVLATIHRLLRAERERLRPRIANLGFDREHHTPHLTPLISMAVHGARPNETELSHRWRQRAWIAMVGFLTSSGRRLLAHAWNAFLRPHERFNRVLVCPTPWRALGSCADRRQPADISPPAHRRYQSLHQPALRRAIRCSHRGTSGGVRSHARCGTCCRESGPAPIARRADLARPPRARSCHRRAALALRADHQDNNDKAGRCGYDAGERG